MTDDTRTQDESEIPVEVEGEATADPEATEEPGTDERIAQLEAEKKEVYDRLLRTAADFENFRKRARRAEEEARIKGREEILKEMLPVVDNLERALQAAEQSKDSSESVVEGVKLVLRQFQSALAKFDVVGFDSMGEPFDPNRHEALAQLESDQPAGTVVQEMERGYLIGPRLLRPALVAVAKPPAAPEESAGPNGEDKEAE